MKARAVMTPQQAREKIESKGISIAEWARIEGFNLNTVYTVLSGRRRCRFGVSHKVAVKLGLKNGVIVDA